MALFILRRSTLHTYNREKIPEWISSVQVSSPIRSLLTTVVSSAFSNYVVPLAIPADT